MVRLFVSDLDGTLLDRSARLSALTRAELAELLASGVRFTVASARSVHTIAAMLGDLPMTLPVIEFNGAFITDLRTRHSLMCHAVEPEIAEAVMRWALAAGICPFVSTYVGGEQQLYPPANVSNAGIAWYLDDRVRARDSRLCPPVDCFATLDRPITCVTSIGHMAALAQIEAQIQDSFPGRTSTFLYENQYSPGWYWLTVQSARATKEGALRELAELCGLGLDAVTVFGDGINDVSMFRCAGRGVAVENAIDELKRIAHEVIGPHHEDSVARYLRRARLS
jgi:5-amino-6-(5-phospho-D-ribitylamino)uracil phosphatase